MGACSCAPTAEPVLPDKVTKAIHNDAASKGAIRILPRSMLEEATTNNALSMCGTDTCDPEAICSWIVSYGDLSDFASPERLAVMKYFATLELTNHWVRFPSAFTLGGYVDGQLGACCTVVPMYQGFHATETWMSELSPGIVTTKMLANGTAPAAIYKSKYRDWRKACLPRLFGKTGFLAMQKRTHSKHGPGAHYYIAMMMVNPAFQGKGLCGKLMRAACRAADAEGLPSYLETGGERNVSVYKRFGYRVVEKTSAYVEGESSYDEIYLMYRDPVIGRS